MGAVKRISVSNARDLPPFLVHGNEADVRRWRSLLVGRAEAEVFEDAAYRDCVV
jgi:hypothetical protein